MLVVKYTSVNKRCAHLCIWSIWSETTQTPFNNIGTGNRVPAAFAVLSVIRREASLILICI